MGKDNTKRNNIVAIVICVLIVAFGIYFVMGGEERDERDRLEEIASSKEDAYNEYMEEIKDIVDSKMKTDQVEVAKISKEALYEIDNEDMYKEIEKGDEYLDKLNKEATKNLNDALRFLLTGFLDRNHYDEIKDFADNENYVSEENIALFNEKRKPYDYAESVIEKAKMEEAKNRIYIGMTKEQVLATNLGEPDDINRTITASRKSEQWVYSDYGKYLYFEDGILVTIQD